MTIITLTIKTSVDNNDITDIVADSCHSAVMSDIFKICHQSFGDL